MAELNGSEQRLIDQIESAFGSLEHPGSKKLAEGDYWDFMVIRRDFGDKTWQELSIGFLMSHFDSLHFFSPAGFHYYLPAYMVAVVTSPEAADLLESTIVFCLTLENSSDSYLPRFLLFTAQQRNAVRQFLEYVRDRYTEEEDNEDPETALASYWRNT